MSVALGMVRYDIVPAVYERTVCQEEKILRRQRVSRAVNPSVLCATQLGQRDALFGLSSI